jgi:serine/threonine-protein phosphatase CPPED1
MKRLLLLIAALGLATGAVTLSRSQNPSSADQTGDLRLAVEDRNPWTHLRLNNDPADFQFAMVSDRTGGHRARVFSQAIEQLNLLQPEFVLSVGDLIEGYSEDRPLIEGEWREFQGYVNQLQMPFFYVPGNHDLTNRFEAKLWQEKFGRRHYHFVYHNVLFLILNSEDPPGQLGSIGDEQLEYIRKALDDNKSVRWTVVAVHRPLWTAPDLGKNGWEAVEKSLASRPYTVFAGHIHRFRKYVRQGRNYYQLATTGGGSRMRGVRYGEFDQIAWVTMKKDGPVIANILLDGVYDADMTKPVSEEEGVVSINRKPVHPVRGKVFFEGTPAPNAVVTFHLIDKDTKRFTRAGDAMAEADGTFSLSTYAANDGAPTGEYAVTVVWWKPLVDAEGKPGPNLLPERFSKPETTPLRATVKAGTNEVVLELKK